MLPGTFERESRAAGSDSSLHAQQTSSIRRASPLPVLAVVLAGSLPGSAIAEVRVGTTTGDCASDPACFNRIHSDIRMVARATPGERIVFHARDAADLDIDPDAVSRLAANPRVSFGVVHPLTGPVYIDGARAGDTLAVTLESLEAGDVGWTSASSGGFAGDALDVESRFIVWRLTPEYAESDALPGVRIPNRSFPGVVMTLPDRRTFEQSLARERQLLDAGGTVYPPDSDQALPASLCGADGSDAQRCLRTIPPREHGGNLDIRYLQAGTTVYLQCMVDGCGLAVGDFHYAQGDGEVAGTAIEMDGTLTVTTRIVRDGPDLSQGVHFEGPARVLAIPSQRFYATTGLPLKEAGSIPREIAYLADARVAGLTNLSNDINLAARNALVAMIDYIVSTYGYDATQAYMIASVAVDLRIGELVDAPNVAVTAVLPLDIFTGTQGTRTGEGSDR
jgi:formamidase